MKEAIKIILSLIIWFFGAVTMLGLFVTSAALEYFAELTEGGIYERRKDKKG